MNYAYSSNNQPFNIQPFTQLAAGLTPLQQGFFNSDPDTAYEQLIKNVNPSVSATDMLRRMLSSLKLQWQGQQAMNWVPGSGEPQSFTDFLTKYNFGKDFAAAGPQVRHENASAFMRPVRTVTF